jgi:hypothetical protein
MLSFRFAGSARRLGGEKEVSRAASNRLAWNIPGGEQEERFFLFQSAVTH